MGKKKKNGKSKGTDAGPPPHKKVPLPHAIAVFNLLAFVVVMRSSGSFSSTLSTLVATDAEQPVDTTSKSYNPLDHIPDPGIDLPTIDEGLYYSSSNAFISSVVSHWPES